MHRIVPASFYKKDAATVARELLGKTLVHEEHGVRTAAMITETEAYVGPEDLACHASKGRTPRTEAMFGPPGRWYVYFVYGMHWMLNVVTGDEGFPAAVLIRGVQGITGPARVAKAFGVDKRLYAQPAIPEAGLWIEDADGLPEGSRIVATPRIGIAYAREWVDAPLRFVLEDLPAKKHSTESREGRKRMS
jgi:DNA-3-methyladenine glycosylase